MGPEISRSLRDSAHRPWEVGLLLSTSCRPSHACVIHQSNKVCRSGRTSRSREPASLQIRQWRWHLSAHSVCHLPPQCLVMLLETASDSVAISEDESRQTAASATSAAINTTGASVAGESWLAQIILKFKRCHDDHPLGKFWGTCNDLKQELDRCFRAEKAVRRRKNFEAAKESKERLQARKAKEAAAGVPTWTEMSGQSQPSTSPS